MFRAQQSRDGTWGKMAGAASISSTSPSGRRRDLRGRRHAAWSPHGPPWPAEEIRMQDKVQAHYASSEGLAKTIADCLRAAGKDLGRITTADLSSLDEFHIRGRKATLELASRMEIAAGTRVLDLGSGLGGPARTLAEVYGCSVTGIDLTQESCSAAQEMSAWVGLADKVSFSQGDATALPYAAASFDAAMTIHVAMNIAAKDA